MSDAQAGRGLSRQQKASVAEDVGITDNVTIGDRCRIGGGSRVFKSLPAGSEVWGHPARPLDETKKSQAIVSRLPQLREELRELRLLQYCAS